MKMIGKKEVLNLALRWGTSLPIIMIILYLTDFNIIIDFIIVLVLSACIQGIVDSIFKMREKVVVHSVDEHIDKVWKEYNESKKKKKEENI